MTTPNIHPFWTQHFGHPHYDDSSLDTAPFGSDEGADYLREIERGLVTVQGATSLGALMSEYDVEEAFAVAERDEIDGLVEIFVRGFAFMRFNGELPRDDLMALRRAVAILATRDGFDELALVVLPDLDALIDRS